MKLLYITALALCFHAPSINGAMSELERIGMSVSFYGLASCEILDGIIDLKVVRSIEKRLEGTGLTPYERHEKIQERDCHIDRGITKVLRGTMFGVWATIFILLPTVNDE
jgi:hypothetical protein